MTLRSTRKRSGPYADTIARFAPRSTESRIVIRSVIPADPGLPPPIRTAVVGAPSIVTRSIVASCVKTPIPRIGTADGTTMRSPLMRTPMGSGSLTFEWSRKKTAVAAIPSPPPSSGAAGRGRAPRGRRRRSGSTCRRARPRGPAWRSTPRSRAWAGTRPRRGRAEPAATRCRPCRRRARARKPRAWRRRLRLSAQPGHQAG